MCVTYDGSSSASGIGIIIDGVAVGLTTDQDTLSATIVNANALTFGRRTTGLPSAEFSGRLDEIAVYDKVLSLVEAQALYNAGAPTDATLLNSEPSLIGSWGMGEDANDFTMINMLATDLVLSTISGVPGGEYLLEPVFSGSFGNILAGAFYGQEGEAAAPIVSRFKMRGRDVTCPVGQQPAYVYWVVETEPDLTAAFATVGDLICGSDPLTDIVEIEVAHRWRDS